MINQDFLQAGLTPTSFAALFNIDVSFMVPTLSGRGGYQEWPMPVRRSTFRIARV